MSYGVDVLPASPSTSTRQGVAPQLPSRLHCRWLPSILRYINELRNGTSPPWSSTSPTASSVILYTDNTRRSPTSPRSSIAPMATQHLHRHQHHLLNYIAGSILASSTTSTLGAESHLLGQHRRRWHSGVIFYTNNTGGSSVPLCSSPPIAFRRDLLHHHHTDDVPAWSSTSIALGAAANPITRLHRRRHYGVGFYINSTGAAANPLARLHH